MTVSGPAPTAAARALAASASAAEAVPVTPAPATVRHDLEARSDHADCGQTGHLSRECPEKSNRPMTC